MYKTYVKDLVLWIKHIQNDGSDIESFYLFLDLMGGVSKADLNLIKIKSQETIYLQENLDILRDKWLEHKQSNQPIQYVCGNAYWRNFKFHITKEVLIPRVETEQIIDIALEIIQKKNCFLLI